MSTLNIGDFYEIVYSQYEKIFMESALSPESIPEEEDKTYRITVNNNTKEYNVKITILSINKTTVCGPGTSTISGIGSRDAYIAQFEGSMAPKSAYLTSLGGIIESNITIDANLYSDDFESSCRVIILPSGEQTIYAAVNGEYKYTESFVCNRGDSLEFKVIPNDFTKYRAGVLNTTSLVCTQKVYYIYATLPFSKDDILTEDDYYIIDCGSAITSINHSSNISGENVSSKGYDLAEYTLLYFDSVSNHNTIGATNKWEKYDIPSCGKILSLYGARNPPFEDKPSTIDEGRILLKFYVSDVNSCIEFPAKNLLFFGKDPNVTDDEVYKFDSISINIINSANSIYQILDYERVPITNNDTIDILYDGRNTIMENAIKKNMNKWVLAEIVFNRYHGPIPYTSSVSNPDEDLMLRETDKFIFETGSSTDYIISKEDLSLNK